MVKKLTDTGCDPIVGAQQEADVKVAAEVETWGDMLEALGLSINSVA